MSRIAGLYIRVSTDDQVEHGFSLEAQKTRLYEYCIKNNISVYKLYEDGGISGKSIDKRTAFQELLVDAKAKKINCVIAYKLDRLSRNLLDLLMIKQELDRVKVDILFTDDNIDASTDTGMAMFQMTGIFAELERKKIVERMMSGKRQKFLETKRLRKLGIVPKGYDYVDGDYIPNGDAALIKSIYTDLVSGSSLNDIYRKHQLDYVLHAQRIIRNPIYKGWGGISYCRDKAYSRKNEMLLDKVVNVTPIVSEELWDKANAILDINKQFARKHPKDLFYLSDVTYCQLCGRKMVTYQTRKDSSKSYLYYYRSNNRINIKCSNFQNINKVHNQFIDTINKLFKVSITLDMKSQSTFNPKTIDNLQKQINTVKNKKNRMLDKLANGIITDDEFLTFNTKLNEELKDLENKLNLATQHKQEEAEHDKEYLTYISNLNKLHDLIAIWDKISDFDRRMIVNETIDKIWLNKKGISKIEFKG